MATISDNCNIASYYDFSIPSESRELVSGGSTEDGLDLDYVEVSPVNDLIGSEEEDGELVSINSEICVEEENRPPSVLLDVLKKTGIGTVKVLKVVVKGGLLVVETGAYAGQAIRIGNKVLNGSARGVVTTAVAGAKALELVGFVTENIVYGACGAAQMVSKGNAVSRTSKDVFAAGAGLLSQGATCYIIYRNVDLDKIKNYAIKMIIGQIF